MLFQYTDVALIIPYRNRFQHITRFVEHIQTHVPSFTIVVVEQSQDKKFNRGKLLNIGFALHKNRANVFCFHDVDMYTVAESFRYYLPARSGPVHLARRLSHKNWGTHYSRYFGGVSLFTKSQFIKANGYSNEYWGWGGEDDDLLIRVERSGQRVTHRPAKLVVCEQYHNRDYNKANGHRLTLLRRNGYNWKTEGLNSLNYFKTTFDTSLHDLIKTADRKHRWIGVDLNINIAMI